MESIYATRQEIQEQLLGVDLHGLILRLEAFAYNLTKDMGLSVEPIDLVYDILLSIQKDNGGRNWNKTKCPEFSRFLFWALKGHVSNEYGKHLNKKTAESGHLTSYQSSSFDMEVLEEMDLAVAKQKALTCLRELGGDADEECVFECWFDGTDKPQDIADLLGVPVETVYNATKRLKRKRPLIKERLNFYHP